MPKDNRGECPPSQSELTKLGKLLDKIEDEGSALRKAIGGHVTLVKQKVKTIDKLLGELGDDLDTLDTAAEKRKNTISKSVEPFRDLLDDLRNYVDHMQQQKPPAAPPPGK